LSGNGQFKLILFVNQSSIICSQEQ